ncbi:MAG: ornithine aminotransferase [Acidobacteria bacterium RIFCSPLOWO2_12_FULL_67_14b]|nr:MAG: ornithine aminotransferase [Acidobacteria bacterium RIFCSPLOWO2_12_FULL_67_14b]
MTDRQLQEHVQNALDWEPSIDAADIGVSVDNGVVTLRGDVKTYAEKAAAEHVALAVYGVKAVANDINVRLGTGLERSDTDIAQAVVSALRWSSMVPDEKIAVVVTNGWVTLSGQVDWEYQRSASARTVRDLTGVRGVTNAIAVVPHASAPDVRQKIEAALKRSAEVDARRINVTAADGKVVLSGNVHSWFERDQARRAAWSAPGVTQVDDRIAIVP